MVIDFRNSTVFPERLRDDRSGFSVDVIIYCPKSDENTIGWYDYNELQWLFLCRQAIDETFIWRYPIDGIDNNKKIISWLKN